jgi:hypothetical protein
MPTWLPPVLIVIGAVVWLSGVTEAIGTLLFLPWAFGFGPVVCRARLELAVRLDDLPCDRVLHTSNCSFKIVGSATCLLRARFAWIDMRVRTPFPLKAVIRGNGSTVDVTARAPLFAVVFFAFWLCGWTVGAVLGLRSHAPGSAVCFGLVGWTLAGAMIVGSIWYERRRLVWALRELEEVAAHYAA